MTYKFYTFILLVFTTHLFMGCDSEGNENSNTTNINNTNTNTTANNAPLVSEVLISGTPRVESSISVTYNYSDSDGDAEGDTVIIWRTGDTEIDRGSNSHIQITQNLAGKVISVSVIPVDARGAVGEEVTATNSNQKILTKYEEIISIPLYDENNPGHILITATNGNWNETVLNDPSYKHFYIEKGFYPEKINLHSSGTETAPRTLSLYNDNVLHPAALPDSEQADAKFYLITGASYWVIDRLSNLDRKENPSLLIMDSSVDNSLGGASHNIINRYHLRNFKYGISIKENCPYNTIQNSYIHIDTNGKEALYEEGALFDAIGIDIRAECAKEMLPKYLNAIGTKILNNEVLNGTDSFQATQMCGGANPGINFEGTILDSNRFWFDSDVYVDIDGSYTPDGEFFFGENMIDLKSGSENPANPMIITNNIMWGNRYRVGENASPFVAHYGVKNVIYAGNIIFDTQGIGLGLTGSYDWQIYDNIFADINGINPEDKPYISTLYFSGADPDIDNNLIATNNTIVRQHVNSTGSGQVVYFHGNTTNNTLTNNVFIDTIKINAEDYPNTMQQQLVDENWFYNFDIYIESIRQYLGIMHEYSTAAEANMADYTFTYKAYTSTPETKTIVGVISTETSPHYGLAGSTLE